MARVLDLPPGVFTLDPPPLSRQDTPTVESLQRELRELQRWALEQFERVEMSQAASRQLQTFENLEVEPVFGNVSGAIAYFDSGVVNPQPGFYKYEGGSWSKL